jgi:hypothetical protein
MATVVEFQSVSGFILDDPIAGVLDNPTYTLDGIVWSDITNKMIEVSIARGKARDLDRFSAGAVSVVLNNEERTFDPLYTSGPYYGQIVPRRGLRITTDGIRQFEGLIDDWNFDYQPGGNSKAEIVASDDFTALARQFVTPGVATPQATGARVTAVLDMDGVQWPADKRTISEGDSVLGADTFEGNALEYLQKVDTSEQGNLFISREGNLVFQDRGDATPRSDSLVTFADDGSGVPYTSVAVNYGTELLVNDVTVTSDVGSANATSERSRVTYGVVAEEIETLVNSTEQLDNLADFILGKYVDPEYRIESLSMNLDTMTPSDKATVLGLELGDVILVKFTPNGIGNAIEQYGQIIKLDSQVQQIRHDITIGIAEIDYTFLVLDDSLFGKLDTDHLGF